MLLVEIVLHNEFRYQIYLNQATFHVRLMAVYLRRFRRVDCMLGVHGRVQSHYMTEASLHIWISSTAIFMQ